MRGQSGFNRLLLSGLLIGILFAAGIMVAKNYLADQLISVMQSEAQAACDDCQFKVDDIEISLINLSAKATNARIEQKGEDKLSFATINLYFDLSEILDKKINLSIVRLKSGFARGVTDQSVTYKFIDRLSTPTPKAKSTNSSTGLKIILKTLEILDSRFTEDLGTATLVGEGVSLSMADNEKKNFLLKPEITTLKIVVPDKNQVGLTEFKLGTVTGEIELTDKTTNFLKAQLKDGRSNLLTKFISQNDHNNALTGKLSKTITSKSMRLSSIFSGAIQGLGNVSGRLARPTLKGSFVKAKRPAKILLTKKDQIPVDAISGDYTLNFTDNGPELSAEIQLENKTAGINLSGPLYLDTEEIKTDFKISAALIEVAGVQIHNFNGAIIVSGTPDQPRTELQGNATSATYLGVNIPELKLNTSIQNSQVKVDAHPQTDSPDRNFQFLAKIDSETAKSNFRIQSHNYPIETTNNAKLGYLSGDVDLQLTESLDMSGKGAIAFVPEFLSTSGSEQELRGQIAFNGQQIDGILQNGSNSLTTTFAVDLRPEKSSSLKIKALSFPNTNLENAPDDCTAISGEMKYNFDAAYFFNGSGNLELTDLKVGCEPSILTIEQSQLFKISAGRILIPNLALKTKLTTLKLAGSIGLDATLDLDSSGSIELSSLIPLIADADDLRGQAALQGKITGSIGDPQIIGSAKLTDAGLIIEAANVALEDFHGELKIGKDSLAGTGLTGYLNRGPVTISGNLDFKDLNKSYLSSEFSAVTLQPNANTNIVVSGNLKLASNPNQQATLLGEISLDSGVFEQDFKLKTLLSDLSEYFLGSNSNFKTNNSFNLPAVALDLNFNATRNFFINTNLWQSELSSKLHLTGTLNTPLVDGNIRSLSGWFGFGDRGFEIVSGVLTFNPDGRSPSLDVLGESEIIARDGGLASIFVELSGTLEHPNIRLSSDRNISESEILTMLGSSSRSFDRTKVNLLGKESELLGFSLLGNSDSKGYSQNLSKVLSTLTKIDSMTVEPAINPDTGLVEPQFIARRNLNQNLSLIGESFLGSTTGKSRAKLLYRLSPKLNIAGIADSSSAQQRSSLGVDLTYTLLAKRKELVNFSISGNNNFSKQELLTAARLDGSTRIKPSDTKILTERLIAFYKSEGFSSAKVYLDCVNQENICKNLSIVIDEGSIYKVSNIQFTRNSWPQDLTPVDFSYLIGQKATVELCSELTRNLIQTLRNDGYIQARANCDYQVGTDNLTTLNLNLDHGRPVSFIFSGNTKFSEVDFIQTIKLFERTQPFGNNTIAILLMRMERLYREHGYLYATISADRSEDSNQRTIYRVFVEEGPQLKLKTIRFQGNDTLRTKEIKRQLRSLSLETYNLVFNQNFAVSEVIDNNIITLERLYRENGFLESSITYNLRELSPTTLELTYQIQEGQKETERRLEIYESSSGQLTQVARASKALSASESEKEISKRLNNLRDAGYLSANIESDQELETSRVVTLIHGQKTSIGKILIHGNTVLSDREILSKLTIQSGMPWSKKEISKSRSILARSGLISSAVFSPADGELNSPVEDILIEISEKPLQTLEVGGGANSELGTHIFGEATDLSLFKDGRALSARVDLYYDPTKSDIRQGTAGLGYYVPEVFKDHSLNSDLRFQRFDLPTLPYDQDRLAWESTLYRAHQSGLSYDFGYSLTEDNLDSVEPSAILSDLDTGAVLLSSISNTLRYDQRDNAINPQSGYLSVLNTTLNSDLIGSDANFAAFNGKLSAHFPLGTSRLTLANASNAAYAHTFSSTAQIPLAERYFTGGRNSIRGFRENSLGPRAEDGTVVGGDILIVNNLELRYLTTDVISVHIFLDTGNSYLRDSGINSSDLRWSTGSGFRYLSPVGPIGFDIGMPIDERVGEPSARFHFSIGNAF